MPFSKMLVQAGLALSGALSVACTVESDLGPVEYTPECSTECELRGACESRKEGCVVTRQEDCEASSECARDARCVLEGSSCVADAAGCASSEMCIRYGTCDVDAGSGRCVAMSAADCQASLECPRTGACELSEVRELFRCDTTSCFTVSGSECVTSTSFCETTPECASEGRCVGNGPVCVLSDEYCAASEECSTEGRCRGGFEVCE